MSVLLAVNAGPSVPTFGGSGSSMRPFNQNSPTVLSERGFSIERATSGTSAGLASNPGDAIVVWTSIYGRDTVAGVTDSVGDLFHQVSSGSMAFGTNGSYNGLSIWIATNATGGGSVGVTVTLHPPYPNSLNDSAVVVVDVTGVAYQPVDSIGPSANSSRLPTQQSFTTSSSVSANATDLVLSGIGARNYDDFLGSAGESRVAEQTGVLSSTTTNAVTTAVFQQTQTASSGTVWGNATSNKSSAWISESFTLKGGGPPPPGEHWLTFGETGLASGTFWTVLVGSANSSTYAPQAIRMPELNGVYNFTVLPVSGYDVTPASGSLTVNGSSDNLTISFAARFSIQLVPTGLPSGTSWTASIGNQSVSTTSPNSLTFQRSAGIYTFTASAPGFTASPTVGSVQVSGAPVTSQIAFTPSKGYAVVFTAGGLPSDQSWSVTLANQTTVAPAGASIEFSEANGTYSYSIGSASGFVPNPVSGSVKVNGNTANQNINFQLPKGSPTAVFPVTFVEQGLPNGTSWSLTVGPKNPSATAPASLNASVQNGSQNYQIKAVTGYTSIPSQGTINEVGRPITVTILFEPGADVKFNAGGLPNGVPWSVDLQGQVRSNSQTNEIDFGRTSGTYNYTIPPVPGYTAKSSSGSVTVASNSVNVGLQFNPAPSPTYIMAFAEQGLSAGTNWSVSIGTTVQSAVAPAPVTMALSSSTYSFTTSGAGGSTVGAPSGTVQIQKTPVNETVSFPLGLSVAPLPVTFVEVGLAAGVAWSISFAGRTVQALAPSGIGYSAANGSDAFSVTVPSGYTANVTSGTVVVNGSAREVPIALTADIQHVVVLVLENNEIGSILSYAPYETYLWNHYGHASNFYGACHDSKPEYTAITSGRAFTCTSFPVESVANLGDLLEAKGLTWAGYFESMPFACDTSIAYPYSTYHNPFIAYADVVHNATRCDNDVVNSNLFNASVANGTLPTVSFYIPNDINDCHNSTLGTCDKWLKGFLSPILNSTNAATQGLVAHTAFVVVYDEGSTNLGYSVGGVVNTYCKNLTGQPLTVCGGHTYLSVVSPYSLGDIVTSDATDYNLESTIEWLFGLGSDGGYDGTTNFASMSGLFSFG